MTAKNAVFGENSAVEPETHHKKLNAELEDLVAIMSSDKSQVKTLLTTTAQLAKTLSKKDATITRLTKEMSNIVNIITKLPVKITALTSAITRQKSYYSTGQGQRV